MKRRIRRSLRGAAIIWYRDVLRFWRDRSRIIASLAQPVLYLFVFGVGLSSSFGGPRAGGAPAGIDYVQFMYPGVLAMTVVFTAVFSAMSIVWDREFGFLREILVAPIGRSAVAVGKALGGSTVAVLQAGLLLLFAPLVGVPLSLRLIAEVLPLMFLLAFSLSCLGIAIASRMKTMEGFQVVLNFLLMPMLFLSGAFFPLQGLPTWLAVVTRLDPAAYGVDPMRRVVLTAVGAPAQLLDQLGLTILGQPVGLLPEILVLAGFAMLMLGLAVRWFSALE